MSLSGRSTEQVALRSVEPMGRVRQFRRCGGSGLRRSDEHESLTGNFIININILQDCAFLDVRDLLATPRPTHPPVPTR